MGTCINIIIFTIMAHYDFHFHQITVPELSSALRSCNKKVELLSTWNYTTFYDKYYHEQVVAPLLSSKSLFAMVAFPISLSLCWMYVCHDNKIPIARKTRLNDAIKWLSGIVSSRLWAIFNFFCVSAWIEAIRAKRPTGKIDWNSQPMMHEQTHTPVAVWCITVIVIARYRDTKKTQT